MSDSVSRWISGIKSRDDESARQLWERYAARLLNLARRQLAGQPPGIADEEDIAQSVFAAVCRGAAAGRFRDLTDRDELWWLLLTVTRRKIADQQRRSLAQKRGGGQVASEADLGSPADPADGLRLDDLMADEPTPAFLVMMDEQFDRLLHLLRDDPLRDVARQRLEGYTVQEIAEAMSLSTRSIERKLQLIRRRWAEELLP
ncbi:ECF-type sigma factor [Pirellulales bacterium]|nr:ECF-type sigma factor [Pirellulales bacterium]